MNQDTSITCYEDWWRESGFRTSLLRATDWDWGPFTAPAELLVPGREKNYETYFGYLDRTLELHGDKVAVRVPGFLGAERIFAVDSLGAANATHRTYVILRKYRSAEFVAQTPASAPLATLCDSLHRALWNAGATPSDSSDLLGSLK